MKNFARLVGFAWPYRVRFALSLGCAMMVALLYATDIAMVLPLLKILFYNKDCQKWVAEEIVSQQTVLHAVVARIEEVDVVRQVRNPRDLKLVMHFREVHKARDEKQAEAQRLEARLDQINLPPLQGKGPDGERGAEGDP
ncbi:ABC transporter ATP-binding protein, partial [Singulisphaera rosea]